MDGWCLRLCCSALSYPYAANVPRNSVIYIQIVNHSAPSKLMVPRTINTLQIKQLHIHNMNWPTTIYNTPAIRVRIHLYSSFIWLTAWAIVKQWANDNDTRLTRFTERYLWHNAETAHNVYGNNGKIARTATEQLPFGLYAKFSQRIHFTRTEDLLCIDFMRMQYAPCVSVHESVTFNLKKWIQLCLISCYRLAGPIYWILFWFLMQRHEFLLACACISILAVTFIYTRTLFHCIQQQQQWIL